MDLLYSEETKKIIGALYKVYNTVGYGYREKEYQKAFVSELEILKIQFSREMYCNLVYNDKVISKFYIDFLLEFPESGVKIVIELKVAEEFHKKYFDQVMVYLKNNNIKLGLLAIFTRNKVLIKRIINEKSA